MAADTLTLSDLQKILIPLVIGFLLAIGGEPMKLWLTDLCKRRKLRRMCYGEVRTIYSALKTGLKSYTERPDTDSHGYGIRVNEALPLSQRSPPQ